MSAVPAIDRTELTLPGCALLDFAGPVGRLALHRPQVQSAIADAPVVLLVHSINAAACAAEMRPLMERLLPYCHVYAMDLPGYGASDRPARVYDIPIFVEAIGTAV